MASNSILSSPLHRQPIRWSLYRPLLQLSASLPLPQQQRNVLQSYIREEFKRNWKMKSVERVKRKVVEGEQVRSLSLPPPPSTSLTRLHDSSCSISNAQALPTTTSVDSATSLRTSTSAALFLPPPNPLLPLPRLPQNPNFVPPSSTQPSSILPCPVFALSRSERA